MFELLSVVTVPASSAFPPSQFRAVPTRGDEEGVLHSAPGLPRRQPHRNKMRARPNFQVVPTDGDPEDGRGAKTNKTPSGRKLDPAQGDLIRENEAEMGSEGNDEY